MEILKHINLDWANIIMGLVGIGLGILLSIIKSIFSYYIGKSKGAIRKTILNKVEEYTLVVVKTTANSVIKEAKFALEDGHIDHKEYKKICKKAKEAAVQSLLDTVGGPLSDILDGTFQEVRDFLSDLIEKKVEEIKK